MKVPAVTGLSEMSISYIGRLKTNNIWVVPDVGEQITVSADDTSFTNLFWLQTDGYIHTRHYRNYFEAYSTVDQVATLTGGVGNALPITYNNVIFSEGIRLVNSSKITFDYDGVYNLQYSIQWSNTDSQAHSTVVWITYNGTPFPDSSTYVSVPSKHGSTNGNAVTAVNFVGKAFQNDNIQLYWSGNSTTVSLKTINPSTIGTLSPLAPVSPSVIVTVTQVA